MVAGFKAWRGRRRIVGSSPLFSRATVKAMRVAITAVRAKAIAADEPIGAKGRVLPRTQDMADRTGDSAIWEAYHVLYRTVSPWTHHSGTSLASHRFEKRADGTHLVVGQPFDAVQIRQIAAAAVSHLIGTIDLYWPTLESAAAARAMGAGADAARFPVPGCWRRAAVRADPDAAFAHARSSIVPGRLREIALAALGYWNWSDSQA